MSRILIVDDEARIRRTFKALLKQRGYKVLTAASAPEAKDLIVHKPIDLILLDINMGEVNGDIFFEVARTFHPCIKIIVSSVFPIEEQHENIVGADDYYDKSDSLNLLIRKMENALTKDIKEVKN